MPPGGLSHDGKAIASTVGGVHNVRSVTICFQSFRSSSAGNCVALWTRTSSLLVDCGMRTQRECHEVIAAHRAQAGGLDAVLVSHAHGDHMSDGALKVLGREGIPILADARVIRQVREGHDLQAWKEPPVLRRFTTEPIAVGDFHVTPFQVPHAPGVPSFGFLVTAGGGSRARTMVLCTDFHDYAQVLPRFVDVDFTFVEANHDLELLRRHPNPSSRYHLNNVKTASLLYHAARRSAAPPRAVMLGHLSEERNRRALALGAVERLFDSSGARRRFRLEAAPASGPSEVIEI